MEWFNTNKLSLSLLKTVSMSFHNNKKIKLILKLMANLFRWLNILNS